MKKKGFTLIELMIVVAIIGILAAIAIPNFLKFQAKARQSEAKTNLASIATTEIAYFAEKTEWGEDFDTIGWSSEGDAKYVYALTTDAYGSGSLDTDADDPNTIAGDGDCNNGTSACAGDCQLDGDDPGVSNPQGFTAIAEGNVDGDTVTDCWGINQQKNPVNERNDVNL